MLPPPPHSWVPKSRIVVSFTTMPRDIEFAYEMLYSIGNQTIQPDSIYINVPYRNKRTGVEYVIPEFLKSWPRLVIQRTDVDLGPLTKLAPTLNAETDPGTIIIVVDDDQIYSPTTISHLAWYSEQEPTVAWGITGWSFMWYPPPREVVAVLVPWYLRSAGGRQVEILQAVKGVVYRRAFFPDVALLANIHPDCFVEDDTWIAGYLATIAKVPRILIPGPWHFHHTFESKDSKHLQEERRDRLSQINNADKEARCIRGIEERLGEWREMIREGIV